MDIVAFRSLSVVFVAIAFFGICWWAFSPKRRKKFDEAANLPFADEADNRSEHGASKNAGDVTQKTTQD